MPDRPPRPVHPADLVALALRVQQDERTPRGDQLAQARRLRTRLAQEGDAPTTDAGRLLWLLDQPGDEAAQQGGRRVRSAWAIVGLIVMLVGVVSGVGLASAVFYYDGDAPVNVVAALGVFVYLQLALLLLALLAALPRGWVRWLPGAEGFQELLRLISPGRLGLLGARLLPQDMREALAGALGRGGAHQRVYSRVQLWAILRWSQLYALMVNLAAVATFLYLVFFSDLAFGWSTTLKIQPADFHRVVGTVALPWSWTDTMTPSFELVERSRYYRGTPFAPEQRGGWWPFVLMAMLVYGLLPRALTVIAASHRLHNAAALALVSIPGAGVLLARLRDPAGTASDPDDLVNGGDEASSVVVGGRPVVIDWSRAAGSMQHAAQLLGHAPASFEPAGGSRGIDEDRAVIESVGRSVGEDGVVFLVKLWEPPVIETTDFLKDLRKAIGERLPVAVVPVASDADGRVIGEAGPLVEQWRRRVAAMGDPWTAVAEPVGLAGVASGVNNG